jgi:hypothetical protein
MAAQAMSNGVFMVVRAEAFDLTTPLHSHEAEEPRQIAARAAGWPRIR